MVLVIEKNRAIESRMSATLREASHTVFAARTREDARVLLGKRIFDVIVTSFEDPSIKLVPFLDHLKNSQNQHVMVVTICDRSSMPEAIESVRYGVFDVIQRPFTGEELRIRIDRAIELKRLRQEAINLRGERDVIYRTDDFIAESPGIRAVLATVNKVAKTDATVLITGETGTGKELIAGSIHYGSGRAANSFVRVNCAALPEELLESELFGHEKGAFTGADAVRVGRFELADGGSIFLDEVGDMSLKTQAKILRVLQEKQFERLGSSKTSEVDVRVVAATNLDLVDAVKRKAFREDLFYRLNVIRIHVPPLRDRPEDVVPLAEFFCRKIAADLKKRLATVADDAKELLRSYSWPGNVRELRNVIERALILSETGTIRSNDLDLPAIRAPADGETYGSYEDVEQLGDIERQAIVRALSEHDWVQKDAAEHLGISRRALNYRIRKFGIRHESWRQNR